MDALTLSFSMLLVLSALVMVVGVARKLRQYARAPSPLKIALTPAPITRSGVALRMLREVLLFHSLFRSNKWTWAFGWLFHVSLALVLVRHLRYFQEPVWGWVALLQPLGTYAGFGMAAGLAGLWARRFLVDRVRYISTPSDHAMLGLLLAIALSGLLMRFVLHTDIVAVKAFVLGLLRLHPGALPADVILLLHLALVGLLMAVFPVSKLLHAPGVFFSPTRAMTDNPRESRHVSAWSRADQKRAG